MNRPSLCKVIVAQQLLTISCLLYSRTMIVYQISSKFLHFGRKATPNPISRTKVIHTALDRHCNILFSNMSGLACQVNKSQKLVFQIVTRVPARDSTIYT